MPSPSLSTDDRELVEAIEQKHRDVSPASSFRVVCAECDEEWPCPPARLAARLRAMGEERDRATRLLRHFVICSTVRIDDDEIDWRVAFGSSSNVEEHCGPWPLGIRERLLAGEELLDEDDLCLVFDHANITRERDGSLIEALSDPPALPSTHPLFAASPVPHPDSPENILLWNACWFALAKGAAWKDHQWVAGVPRDAQAMDYRELSQEAIDAAKVFIEDCPDLALDAAIHSQPPGTEEKGR